MTVVSFLASPPSNLSVQAHARVLKRFTIGFAVILGFLPATASLRSISVRERPQARQDSVLRMYSEGILGRADDAAVKETPRPRSPGAKKSAPTTRVARDQTLPLRSDAAWGGQL